MFGNRGVYAVLCALDRVDRLPQLGAKGAYLKQSMADRLIERKQYIDEHGEDLPEIRNWKGSPQGK